MSYSIGELAEAAGVSVRTLHHYDEIDLLNPSYRTAVGHRRYTEADRERLERILAYRELGFDLATITRILDDSAVDVEKELRQQRASLHEKLGTLRETVRRLETMMNIGKEADRDHPTAGARKETAVNGRAAAVMTVCATGGAFAGILDLLAREGSAVSGISLAVLIAATLAASVYYRSQGTPRLFFREMFLGWAAFGVAWTLVHPRVAFDLGAPTALVAWAVLIGYSRFRSRPQLLDFALIGLGIGAGAQIVLMILGRALRLWGVWQAGEVMWIRPDAWMLILAALVLLGMVTMRLSAAARGPRKYVKFQVGSLAIWISFLATAVWGPTSGPWNAGLLVPMVALIGGAATIGGIVGIRYRSWSEHEFPTVPQS